MFSETPELYDLIYGSYKDYAAEAKSIAELIAQSNPSARSVLDVACGTGEHALHLAKTHGYKVDGLDIEPAFVRIAASKLPCGRFAEADMCGFDLGRRYEAVICLFSAIGYVRTLENPARTIGCFSKHVVAGGVVIVEPWFVPDQVESRRVFLKTGETSGVQVCRMGRMTVDDRMSRLEFEYLIGLPEGIRRASEVHELGLFTVDEMTEAFVRKGFEVEYDPTGPTGRGLYVARVAP